MTVRGGVLTVIAGTLLLAGRAGADTTTVTFDSGTGGWDGVSGSGGPGSTIEPTGGNPGANWRTVFNDFGLTFTNATAPFAQDYTQFASITLSIDVKVNDISFFGSPVTRPFLVELRDFDSADPGLPWASAWFKFDDIGSDAYGRWTTLSVTITDPLAAALPAGWRGYGSEDPVTFEPILPAGVTFADILGGFDEIAFTTFEPGWFFGFTDFDIQLDNITITTTPVPAPGSAALLFAASALAARRRR
ncbi:MAG: PEP-CTERM sorting domain-containing protein [Phycisphaerales bacterium]|nr:PEP-CTERM sorting domain-containing protein [Phycisphaerales bacterium]